MLEKAGRQQQQQRRRQRLGSVEQEVFNGPLSESWGHPQGQQWRQSGEGRRALLAMQRAVVQFPWDPAGKSRADLILKKLSALKRMARDAGASDETMADFDRHGPEDAKEAVIRFLLAVHTSTDARAAWSVAEVDAAAKSITAGASVERRAAVLSGGQSDLPEVLRVSARHRRFLVCLHSPPGPI